MDALLHWCHHHLSAVRRRHGDLNSSKSFTRGLNDPVSCLSCRESSFTVPAFPAIEVDPTGAGDSFLAGFVCGLCKGLPLDAAVRMGNFFGSLAVQQVGIPQVTQAVMKEWMRAASEGNNDGPSHV